MTQSTDSRTTGNQEAQQKLHELHLTWWDHRFTAINTSSNEVDKPIQESLRDFWTGDPTKYANPSEDGETIDQTELSSVGNPPEEFAKAFEIVNQYHHIIRESQIYETQFTQDTPISSIVEEIPRVGSIILTNLKKEGYDTFGDLDGATRGELIEVNHVGTQTAERLLEFIHQKKAESRDSSKSRDKQVIADEVDLQAISDDIPGLGDVSRKKIQKAGYETVGDVRTATIDELTDIKQIGEETASKLIQYAEDHTGESTSTADSETSDEIPVEDFAANVPRVGRVLISKLTKAGYETVGDLRAATVDDLITVDHIGHQKAELLLEHANSK